MKLKTKVALRRHVKYWFVRLKLHRLAAPFAGLAQHLAYLSKFSQWCHAHFELKFSDFHPPTLEGQKRYELYEFLLSQEHLGAEIDYLEFGVAGGESLQWWLAHNHHPASRFAGFDSFAGLPEDFGLLQKGTFARPALPTILDARCRLVVGLFQDTLYDFLQTFSLARKTVIHLDADLYSSTLFVLATLARSLKPGDVLIFDEFGVPTHEFRAFLDFSASFPLRFEVLGETGNYSQVAMKVV